MFMIVIGYALMLASVQWPRADGYDAATAPAFLRKSMVSHLASNSHAHYLLLCEALISEVLRSTYTFAVLFTDEWSRYSAITWQD